jgi:glutamyl-Q tRNA(Asp) synthetase
MGSDPNPPNSADYRGRFAPSPSGPLHFGSLVAATASYLQALTHGGEWLLRIEDIDPPREVAGATDAIVRSLESHAFRWDGQIHRQSRHLAEYHAVAERLLTNGFAYRCTCTRDGVRRSATTTGLTGPVYAGTCRNAGHHADANSPDALRLRTGHSVVTFTDAIQGRISCDVAASIGDFILRRKDGLIAYNLAVVIDDARQGITEVVRGIDLLDITPAQIELQQALELTIPNYMHIPVVTNAHGQKLSKQTGASPVNDRQPGANLVTALKFLRQDPPGELADETVETIWTWATDHWQPDKLAAERQPGQGNTYK